jgi:hypothetical protein
MTLLSQFLLRLAFGLAVGMAITSSRKVASGYFRNHLYVTLGLATLAFLVALKAPMLPWWPPLAAAIASYVGAVCWLYERPAAGRWMLWLVAGFALTGAIMAPWLPTQIDVSQFAQLLHIIAPTTSGLLLGITMAAMLLGHWYLNSPGMELAPLRRLLIAMAVAVGIQILVSSIGLAAQLSSAAPATSAWWMLLALRWSFGLLGTSVLIWMAWETLKIPNTQSATGILYVAVIGTFVGELTSLLLSANSSYPL